MALDVPPSVLRDLDNSGRNDLVVRTYRAAADMWAKTLVFAVDVQHADELGTCSRRSPPDGYGCCTAGRVTGERHSTGSAARTAPLCWCRSACSPRASICPTPPPPLCAGLPPAGCCSSR